MNIHIYDVTGRLVRSLHLGQQAPGFYDTKSKAAHWDGKNASGETVTSGLYFYRFMTDNFTETRRLLIQR